MNFDHGENKPEEGLVSQAETQKKLHAWNQPTETVCSSCPHRKDRTLHGFL